MVTTFPRPTPSALLSIGAIQDDPKHPCRVSGLPLLVDLLADRVAEGGVSPRPGRADGDLIDADGLHLLVPPFGALLARASEEVVLTTAQGSVEDVTVRLPLAGALFAGKVGSLALEQRAPEKRASDGEDAVRLVEAFGSLALIRDLEHAIDAERTDLRSLLDAVRGSGLVAQAKVSGHVVEPQRIEEACRQLLDWLR